MALSTADFVSTIRRCRLLEPVQLQQLDLRSQGQDPRILSKQLMQRGWLTPYQVNHLLQGKGADLVLGAYVLLERLGEGGMGAVFKAKHQNLGRVVALKLIAKQHLEKPEAVHRFRREIQAVARLSHPNIVLAFDADQIGDLHFFTMEYINGTNIERRVQQSGPLQVPQACDLVRQAALGLQHAFERGLIHRDIKPSNLLLTAAYQLKILDMGLALIQNESTGTLTKFGNIIGTPDYIAPEQARNSHLVDIRSDLYSLGCCFYFMLAGQVPFPHGTSTEKLLSHVMDEPQAVEQLRPEVPKHVGAIVRRLMAKKPEMRYQTPAELAAALGPSQANAAAPAALPVSKGRQLAVKGLQRSANGAARLGQWLLIRFQKSQRRQKIAAISVALVLPILICFFMFVLSGSSENNLQGKRIPPDQIPVKEAWPGDVPGLILAWKPEFGPKKLAGSRGATLSSWKFTTRDNAKIHGSGMELTEGAVIFEGGEAVLVRECRQTNQLGIEVVIMPEDVDQDGPARIVTFSSDASTRNFTLGQEEDELVFRLRTPNSDENSDMTLCKLAPGWPLHVIVCYRNGELACYIDGKRVELKTASPSGDLSNWTTQHLLFGDEWTKNRDWLGRLERVAFYNRFIDASTAKTLYDLVVKERH